MENKNDTWAWLNAAANCCMHVSSNKVVRVNLVLQAKLQLLSQLFYVANYDQLLVIFCFSHEHTIFSLSNTLFYVPTIMQHRKHAG